MLIRTTLFFLILRQFPSATTAGIGFPLRTTSRSRLAFKYTSISAPHKRRTISLRSTGWVAKTQHLTLVGLLSLKGCVEDAARLREPVNLPRQHLNGHETVREKSWAFVLGKRSTEISGLRSIISGPLPRSGRAEYRRTQAKRRAWQGQFRLRSVKSTLSHFGMPDGCSPIARAPLRHVATVSQLDA